ncbi:aspartate-semialdehyde dehydrogenase [Caldalkalibacillus uzonensis]|uniref:Aspartate-semialdehyde dehydrogenase n=2 Tax=Caldalkalibacillus uzonensis TaxID=353224 RepID=A0ABU0CLM7_9BACI|nr:aspartate-semialdehyde dehydrogenase [Caldalkalibacillus uzonensis]
MSTQTYHVAVVGATGAVGQQMVKLLEERQFPIHKLTLLASRRSAGKQVSFKGEQITVQETTPDAFEEVDIALFSAGGSVSKQFAKEAVKRGALVIDNTNAFRMEPDVPLVVPEVNMGDIAKHQGIISNPNCSTIQMVVALKPIKDKYGLKRIIVSTYQAVSGAGNVALEELKEQSAKVLNGEAFTPEVLPVAKDKKKFQIAFNAIPQIDLFQENDYTLEEMKMVRETKKIMHDDTIEVVATCVRIPVFTGHSESVYVETEQEVNVEEVRQLLREAPGVIVEDNPAEQEYPLATRAAGRPEVFVGRIRRDLDRPNGLHMWVVSDNLLKGAAYNSIQIAEAYISKFKS